MFINFKKYLIVISEKKNESTTEIKLDIVKFIFSSIIKFFNPKKETAPKIGSETKNDILAASILLKPNNLAAVIAIPDLLTPGIKAKI